MEICVSLLVYDFHLPSVSNKDSAVKMKLLFRDLIDSCVKFKTNISTIIHIIWPSISKLIYTKLAHQISQFRSVTKKLQSFMLLFILLSLFLFKFCIDTHFIYNLAL